MSKGIITTLDEYLIYGTKSKEKKYNSVQKYFWVLSYNELAKEENRGHGSQKPFELINKMILEDSKVKDLVLEPFAGSGTVALACKNLDRNFISIELNKEHYEKAKRRLNE